MSGKARFRIISYHTLPHTPESSPPPSLMYEIPKHRSRDSWIVIILYYIRTRWFMSNSLFKSCSLVATRSEILLRGLSSLYMYGVRIHPAYSLSPSNSPIPQVDNRNSLRMTPTTMSSLPTVHLIIPSVKI